MSSETGHPTSEEGEGLELYRYAGRGTATLSTGHVVLEMEFREDWNGDDDEPVYVTGFVMSREECRDLGEALIRLAQAPHPPPPKPDGAG